jgi:hypothetical protein
MQLSDDLLCLFTARVEEWDDSYLLELPKQEMERGMIQSGGTYRVGLFPAAIDSQTALDTGADRAHKQDQGPPVDEGEQRTVGIEDSRAG